MNEERPSAGGREGGIVTTEHVETVEIASARGLLNRTIGEYRDGACEITAVNRAVMVLIAAVRAESEAEIARLRSALERTREDWQAEEVWRENIGSIPGRATHARKRVEKALR